jgi:hypothetical protein
MEKKSLSPGRDGIEAFAAPRIWIAGRETEEHVQSGLFLVVVKQSSFYS